MPTKLTHIVIKDITLQSLVGAHILTGVDFEENPFVVEDYPSTEDSTWVNFILDGKTYTAVEDPDDGYRSRMDRISTSNKKVVNTFKPVKVIGTMGRNYESEIISFYSRVTGELILRIGTDMNDDYYPYFIGEFIPENIPRG